MAVRKSKQVQPEGAAKRPPMSNRSVRLPDHVLDALVRLAEKGGTTVNYQILVAVEEYLGRVAR